MEAPIRIIPKDAIGQGAVEPPRIVLPAPAHFGARAARLRALAGAGHSSAAFLAWMATLADAQQAAFESHPSVTDPAPQRQDLARAHGLPLLGTDSERDPQWRVALELIASRLSIGAAPAIQAALEGLRRAPSDSLERAASALLACDFATVDPAQAPFLAAALQVHWVKRAAQLGPTAFGSLDVPNVCPVCGSAPIASVLRIDVPAPGTRYLHCALCETEWLFARGECSSCAAREGIAYLHAEGASEAVKAETCESCKTYRKLLNAEQDALVDPIADDLATLTLDLALDEAGYRRSSPNLLFIPGPA